MDPSDPAAPFVPTLARARKDGIELPPGDPVEERLVVLIVHATLLRRRSWSEDTALQGDMMSKIEHGAPPVPTDFAPQSHVRIEQEISVDTCGTCAATPGLMMCRVCKGTGLLSNMNWPCSCDKGYVVCPVCQGERQSRRVRLRYFTDEPLWVREAYVPTPISHVPALFSFESTFERTVEIDVEPPECLRCHDLSDRVGGTAYRGGQKRQKPDFKGHDFVDTIDKALAGLAALTAGASVPLYSVRAYAWPVLWLHYNEGSDIALFTRRDGWLQSFGK